MNQLVIPPRPPAPVIDIGDISKALAVATDPVEIKEIGAKLDAFEQYMHDCGLYNIEDMRPINEARMAARWKLGRALAKIDRAQGKPHFGKRLYEVHHRSRPYQADSAGGSTHWLPARRGDGTHL